MMTLKRRRPDFSQALVHLTKERDGNNALDVLKKILTSGILRASGNEGYIKGSGKAVCLSEIPLSSVHLLASPPEKISGAKYRFYGVAISKEAVFGAGGRPVIYLPDAEANWIPEEHRWRHVRFEYSKVDWTHEREWRIPKDLDLSSVPGVYILVWSATEVSEIYETISPIRDKIRGGSTHGAAHEVSLDGAIVNFP